MARRTSDENRWVDNLTCAGGINRQLDAIRSEQCYDARNVWERGGRVVQRPGYIGVGAVPDVSTATTLFARKEVGGVFTAPGAGGTLSLAGLVPGNSWYLGASVPFDGANVLLPTANTDATVRAYTEYWNGSEWQYAPLVETIAKHLRDPGAFGVVWFRLPAPGSWTEKTVDGQAAYWWRFTIQGGVGTAITAGTQIDVDGAGVYRMNCAGTAIGVSGYAPAGYPGGGSVTVFGSITTSTTSENRVYSGNFRREYDGTQASISYNSGPRFLRSVTSFSRAGQYGYSAANNRIIEFVFAQTTSVAVAAVERADWAVGSNQVPPAPYDKTLVAQLEAFPAANLVSFFQNRLWATDIIDEPTAVRWGAPYPYHKVWAGLAIDYVDQKPTGLKPLGENQTVYTQDSIYSMVLDSISDFNIPLFKAIKVVPGRGCVAHESIQEIDGRHVFLSEDGLYAYNGTADVAKVTNDKNSGQDRLFDVFSRITESARQFSSSAHWRKQKMYLLSIPVDGSYTNNLTIAWDYAKDKFWLWDNVPAQHWIVDNSPNSDEELYFITLGGAVYKFGVGDHDNYTATETYVVSRPIGFGDFMHKGLEEVKVLANSIASEMDIEVWPQGISQNAKTGTLNFDDYREAKWGTAIWGTSKWAEPTRRFQHQHYKLDGSWFQIKLTGAGAKGKPFEFSKVAVFVFNKYEDTR